MRNWEKYTSFCADNLVAMRDDSFKHYVQLLLFFRALGCLREEDGRGE